MIDYYDADSNELFGEASGLNWADDDPLASRLRTMSWTRAPDEVRERCWREIKARVETLELEQLAGTPSLSADVNCDRYLYSRRREPCRVSTEPRRVTAPVRHFRPRALAWAFR